MHNYDISDILNMSNEELLAFAFSCYEDEMAGRKDEDYEVNTPQMDKFAELYRFFIRISKENNCKLEPIRYSPKEEHGDLVVYFNLMYLYGNDVTEFTKVLSYASAFDISALSDGTVCMSMKIPNIFKRKQ